MSLLLQIGRFSIAIVQHLGRTGKFFPNLVSGVVVLYKRPKLLIQQLYSVGVMTVLIVAVAGLFVGMMLGFQVYYTLVDFGAESSLGLAVALFLTRELGPVLTALLFAGRAGSAITAEIGLMRMTQQLDAMEMMAVDPMIPIVAPRFFAAFLAMPLLAALFSVVGLGGGYIVSAGLLNVDPGSYWAAMESGVDVYEDVWGGILKSIVFGFVVSWISVFEGYYALPSTNGISKATTRAVVTASLTVLGFDYLLTAIMF